MCAIVETITGISRQFLLSIAELHDASVAQRMSWAAQRDTTRKEDLAYCLLGIFGVTMSMIYGEGGDQAFFRLQEQIMRTTRDDSILAWGLSLTEPIPSNATEVTPGTILAAAPSDFVNCRHIISREQSSTPLHSLDISGGSLRIYLSLLTTSASETIGLLKCGLEHDTQQVVGIPLRNATSRWSDEYIRPRGFPSVLLPMAAANASSKLIHIKNDRQSKISTDANRRYWFYGDGFAEINLDLIDVAPRSCWDKERTLIVSTIESDGDTTHRTLARFRHKEEGSRDFVIVLEIEEQKSCVEAQCYVMICSRDTLLEELAENVRYMMQKAFGKRSASNGMLNLHVTWESVARQPMYIIRPDATFYPPEVTVDATLELQQLDLRLEFARILEEEGQNDIEQEELEQMVKERNTRLEQMKKELEVVEYELKKLTEKKNILVEWRKNGAQEIYRLNERYAEIKERQESVSERRLHAQQRWNEILHTNCGGDCYESEAMDGRTLLRWAAEHGHEAMVKLLLDTGKAGIDSKDKNYGQTPLSWAADLESKDKEGRMPLSWAAEKGHEAVVKLLLEKGAELDSKDSRGRTPLSWAAANGHEAVVKLLLEKGAERESKDSYGQTPLSWAAENGHEAVVKLLLGKGAELDSKDSSGRTPLWRAAANGHKAVVKLLLGEGAELDSKDSRGRTPLWRAAAKGHKAVVKLLLGKGAELDSKDSSGRTPLSWAAANGHEAVVKLLLEKGAERESKDDYYGRTPLSWAAANGHEAVVKLLLEKGAERESKDSYGQTPLSWAAANGHEAVVKLLLGKGAELDSKDSSGRTPLSWAAANGHEAVAKLLASIT